MLPAIEEQPIIFRLFLKQGFLSLNLPNVKVKIVAILRL